MIYNQIAGISMYKDHSWDLKYMKTCWLKKISAISSKKCQAHGPYQKIITLRSTQSPICKIYHDQSKSIQSDLQDLRISYKIEL